MSGLFTDSYVKVCLFKGKQRVKKKKTSVIFGTNNPSYNQALSFNVPNEMIESSDIRLTCYVMHEGKLVPNVYLGQISIGPG